jgi:hypothetical protein
MANNVWLGFSLGTTFPEDSSGVAGIGAQSAEPVIDR